MILVITFLVTGVNGGMVNGQAVATFVVR